MKKCGLRKAYAGGGLLDAFKERQAAWNENLDDGGAGSVGILEDPNDRANAEKTARWALQDQASKAHYDPRTRDSRGLSRGMTDYVQQFGNTDEILGDVNRRLRQGFQNGGVPRKETTDELLARMRATYGGAPAAEPAPAPAPVQATPQPVAAKPQGFIGGIRAALDPERRMKAAGFENGGRPGVDDRGFIHGPKGVDKVPAKVADTGEDILVTAGERIVNKEQNAELEKLAAEKGMGLDEYLEATTGKPVGPKLKGGLRAAQGGWPVPYDPILAQQAAPGGANTYAPRSTVPVQDGVRMAGQQSAPGGRPNWIDPTRQVATIDSTAQRVPNGPGTAVVPTNGRTQFHDKITAEEMARGNQNRAAGFRAAAEAAEAADAAPAAPQVKQPAGMGTKLVRGLGAAAMAVPIANTSRSDAPTVVGKLKEGFGGEAPLTKEQSDNAQYARDNVDLPWWAGPNGAMVPNAKLAEVGEGQKMRDTHEANLVDGPGKGKFEMPKIDKAAARRNTQNALVSADTNTTEGNKARNIVGAAQTSRTNGLDYATLEQGAKGGRSDFMGEKDATEYQLPEGMRGGFVTRSADKQGLRKTTYLSGEASAADKARDAEFEAKGYGKDAYGNWVTPQRLADKQALSRIERERAEFNAFSDQVTDPNARAAGLRAMMLKYGPADKAAADAAKQQAEQALTIRGQDITLRGQDNMQANNERDYKLKVGESNSKDIEGWMEKMAPTAGLKDEALAKAQSRRAMLQQVMLNHWGGNVPTDRARFQSEMPKMARQAEATMRLYDVLSDQGLLDRYVRNSGSKPSMTLQALSPSGYDQKDDMLILPDGYKVRGKELWGNNADMREAMLSRIQTPSR